MTERDEDELEIFESRKALQAAKFAAVKTDAAVAEIHRTTSDVRSIVGRNGYVDRFRDLLRGA